MAEKCEIDAFEKFRFSIGQKVKSQYGGHDYGFVVARMVVDTAGGIRREYLVRHSGERQASYFEFEITEHI